MALANLFLYCYFGKVATESYQKMCIYLFESNWPDLPADLQRFFIIMIANAQRPLYYHGFGFAMLNLETFTRMIKAVGTYYMMFKTITTE